MRARLAAVRSLTPTMLIAGAVVLSAPLAIGQEPPPESPPFDLIDARLQRRATGAVTLMSYSVTPDSSASSLSIDSGSTDNPGLTLWQLGAGFTLAAGFPLYLEGFLGTTAMTLLLSPATVRRSARYP